MSPTFGRLTLASGLCAASFLLSPVALGQSAEGDFYKAHYLHRESGELNEALELYQGVARSSKGGAALREKARRAIAEIREDLACSDFSQLMPANTIFYAELNHPGDRLGGLLSELGLLASEDGAPGIGISPKLLGAALDLRGAALAVTEIDPNGGPPSGVLVLHPGDQEALRGLIETAVGNGGRPVDSIEGAPTWSIEGEAYVTLTRRLVIASPEREAIAGVLARMNGDRSDSFAGVESMAHAADLRGDDLIFFHVNAEPILPMINAALEEGAKHDPDIALARAFLDPESLLGLTGRVGVSEAGIGLDLSLQLEEGHQNLAFNLLRTPPIEEDTLRDIPGGVAFFLATSLNRPGPLAASTGSSERPIVTAMDFGREVFANIVDVTVFGMPGADEHGVGEHNGGPPIPNVVASISVNDGNRSRALWDFVLNMAAQSSGGASEPVLEKVAGREVERYSIEGIPIYLHTSDHELLISPSRAALEHTFAARRSGNSVLDDPLFGQSLEELGSERNTVVLVSPSRCARFARGFMNGSDAREMDQMAHILQDTIVCVGVGQTDTEFNLSARIANVPDISPLMHQWMQERRGYVGQRRYESVDKPGVALK